MADKKITELTLRSNVSDDVNFPVDDGIQSYRVTAAQAKTYMFNTQSFWLPFTTIGDLLYATTSGVRARLGIGSTGQSLQVVGGVPAWAANAKSTLNVVTAASTPQIPSATDNFNAGAGNSITLTAGTWRINTSAFFGRVSGNNPAYSFCGVGLFGANGNNTNSAPTALTSVANLTVNSVYPNLAGVMAGNNITPTFLGGINTVVCPEVIVTCTATVTIYAVTFANMVTAADSAISTYTTAQQIF